MAAGRSQYVVDFPTLWVVPAWIERHCIIPDGFRKGQYFRMYDWQLWCTVNHYRIKPRTEQVPGWGVDPDVIPIRAGAFHNRRSQVIAPQKTGKGPWTAAIVSAEAVGPVLFLGWAGDDDVYDCADHGCGCGWVYRYKPGEAMGHAWPTPLIQLLATSEDQVDNVYRPLQAMARGERLADRMKVREGFIRVTGGDGDPDSNRIDVVTSSAMSRLGNPITFCAQDETGLYTDQNKLVKVAQTMRRGAAAMGGRSVETTNCYDPSEKSVAQRTHEGRAKDVFKFYEPPPADLKYKNKADRKKIHAFNYAGSPHADLAGIEGEAAELIETDPGQAERFYGNRIVAGLGTWMDGERWEARKTTKPVTVPLRSQIVLGFDGSDVDDWTGIRAQTRDGYQFTPDTPAGPTIWDPADYEGRVPRLEVAAAVDWLFANYDVVRMYADPPYWETEIDTWAEKYGVKRVLRWETYRPVQMHAACERILTDVAKADSAFAHDGCEVTKDHMGAARKAARPSNRYVLTKPGDGRKIDMAVVSVICNEAAGDVTAAKLWRKKYYAYTA
ncbi:hypothetical protein [Amycolatopsis dendrobii]|uniref:Terminase n=1 Tax=Amycolatopsis dendrobii TaxID=2760662 RepID=A0A7W3ZAS1_9PSEU|nr:hypothetical protein [Amycolatopsis dendrobii]MBB1153988.1 hypothetical protein [Amycolatopsis dendrobii]